MRVLVLLVATAAVAVAGANAARAGGGVSVTVPAGWHVWTPRLQRAPAITDPVTRLVVASAPFAFAPRSCQVASYRFPADAVAIVVVEWTKLERHARWPPRPRRFTAASLPVRPPPAIECFDGPGGSVQFADRGRHFGVYLLVGRSATPAVVERARGVLDTLAVAPP